MTGPDKDEVQVTEHLPVVDGRERSVDEQRADVAELRQELGGTVEELAHRLDVPARVKERRDETVARARHGLTQVGAVLDEKAPPVGKAVREQPAWVAGASVALVVAVIWLVRRSRT